MGLHARSVVYLVQVLFFAPTLILSLIIAAKQGMSRNMLWIYICILSILRMVGGITGILAQYHPNNRNIVETSVICSTVGLSPLLMGWLSVLGRINNGMSAKRIPSIFILSLHLPVMAALGMAIHGGTNLFDDNDSEVHHAITWTKVAIVIFAIMFITIALLNAYFFLNKRNALLGEHKLLYAGLLVTPFLFVRVLYSILADFNWGKKTAFSMSSDAHNAVVVEAIMFVVMEFIIVIVWLLAGLFTKKVPKELLSKSGRNSARAQSEQEYYKLSHPMHQMNQLY